MSARQGPADAAVRRRIITETDRSGLVEASAGTGKTSLLVGRILHLLGENEVTLERVAAITFTEKAAGELKTRLRDELQREARAATEDLRRARLFRALPDLDRAAVSTIHAFCSQLLHERPVEAGLPPGFETASEVEARLLFEEAWDGWIQAELGSEDSRLGPVLAAAGEMNASIRALHGLASVLVENRDLVTDLDRAFGDGAGAFPAGGDDVESFAVALAAALASIERMMGNCTDPADAAIVKLRPTLERARRHVTRLRSGGRRTAAVALDSIPLAKIGNVGRKGSWRPPSSLQDLRDVVKDLHTRHEEFARAWRGRLTLEAVRTLEGFLDSYAELKARRGVLDFQDLLIRTRDLVRDHPGVRRDFQAAFTHLLVDEFQDTDPLQAEIVFLLSGDDPEERDWEKVRVAPGRLFLVGDPKQSIYRFRRADIQIYERAREVMARSGGEIYAITVNFRTRIDITDWINELFARLMDPAEASSIRPAYAMLSAHRDGPRSAGEDPLVETVAVPDPPAGETWKVERYRLEEARRLAALIRDRVEGGRWSARWGDVALLFRTFSSLLIFEDVFRAAGIPYRVDGGRYYFQRIEVQSLLAVLRAVDNPTDRAALVAALRSPLFGFDDETLLLAAEEGRLDYSAAGAPSDAALAEVFGWLSDWHVRRHTDGPAVLIEEILARTRAVELFALKPLGEQRVANLAKVADQARPYRDRAGAFRAFLRHLSEREASQDPEAESPTLEEGEGSFVHFLTVHKAKGLEYPIVILADMAAIPNEKRSVIVDRASGRLGFSLGQIRGHTGRTPGWDDLEQADRDQEAAELIRLFYVAVTRARDRLILPVGRRAAHSFRALLPDGLLPPAADLSGLPLEPAPEAAFRRRLPAPAGDGVPPADLDLARARFAAGRAALLEGLPRGARDRSPSLAAAAREEEEAAFRGGRDGTRARALGSFVHAVLQSLDREGKDLDLRIEGLRRDYPALGPEDVAGAARLCRAALASDVWRRAWDAPRLFREAPFLGAAGGPDFIGGVVDLAFEEAGGLVVVDFKTDRIDAAGVDPHFSRYRGQALGYALGVGRAAGVPVREVAFLFLDTGEVRSLPVTDSVLAEAEALFSI